MKTNEQALRKIAQHKHLLKSVFLKHLTGNQRMEAIRATITNVRYYRSKIA